MKKMKHIFKILKNNITILDIIICFILGLIYSFFPEYYINGSCNFKMQLLFKSFFLFIIFFLLTILFRYIINKINNSSINKKCILFSIFDENNKLYKYRLLILAFIILIFWLPIIICLFPGTLSNDTWGQLNQYNSGNFNDHHPIFDTLYMGSILFSFNNLYDDWHISFFIYVLFQSIITSLVFSYSIIYAKEKLKLKNIFLFMFLIIYALLPIFPSIVQSINKDTIFSWIYVLFFISFIEIVRTKGLILARKRNLILIIIISILCCLTKKVGVYILVISYISLLLTIKFNKKRIIYILSSIVILMFICMPFLLTTFNVKLGGEQEKYSLLFQQTARYLKYHSEDVTKEEKDLIEEVFGNKIEKIIKAYEPTHADAVKGYTQKTKTENYRKYILVWFKQGLRHPKTYFDASNCMLSGWMSFRMYKPLMNMDRHSQFNINIFKEDVTKRTLNKDISDKIQDIYDNLYEIPVLKYLFTPGMYVSLIPLFSLATILKQKKKRKNAIVLVPLFSSIILGCFLSPTSSNTEGQRYLYPVIYTSILTIMWTIYTMKKEK